MNYRFSHLSIGTILALTLLFPGKVTAASGDIIPPPEPPKDERLVVFKLPFEDTDPAKIKDLVGQMTIQIRFEEQNWKFKFLPDTYTIQPQTYMMFHGQELPVPESKKVANFPTKTKYTLSITRQVLIDFITQNIESKVNKPKQDVTIREENGKIVFDGTAENGRVVEVNSMIKKMRAAIARNLTTLDAAVLEQPGLVFKEGLPDLEIKELLSTGLSDFGGSPSNRIHNIKTGMKRFNGVVIKKDSDFSFNDQLGEVDGAHGFLPELVIKGPDTIPEFGGGLCQTSTTAFRAALYAGLPILERRNHSYAVSYYVWPLGWGFDATIYIGVVDLKFKNDTPGDILVQTYTDGTHAYYKFYGIKDNRTIEVGDSVVTGYRSPPPAKMIETSSLPAGVKKVKENAHTGLTAYFTRDVTYESGETVSEKFTSVYQARPTVYMVGKASAPAGGDEYYTGDIGG